MLVQKQALSKKQKKSNYMPKTWQPAISLLNCSPQPGIDKWNNILTPPTNQWGCIPSCDQMNGDIHSAELDTQSSVLVLPNHQHTLKMGTELVPETSENLHFLTQLSPWENFTEFCHSKSCNTYVIHNSLPQLNDNLLSTKTTEREHFMCKEEV